ncbi:MAG: pilus (MSHA type) biogenesis protein MshL [Chlorobium sp.]|nr:pilus (MSHA type) biogenesis protein MshL [Chlorobium sp.]
MKLKNCLVALCLALLLAGITSCGAKKNAKDQGKTETPPPGATAATPAPPQPAQLPVRYQSPGFVTAKDTSIDELGEEASELQIKVGATIRSTGGPQPLWDVMKRLANLKKMTVSWSSDVDRTLLVDVDIAANDNFFDAISNLLRQADYFHEVKGKSLIIRNKMTKTFQIGVPAMKGGYTTNVGGNFLASGSGSGSGSSGMEGTVKITSPDNKFDIWTDIEANINKILKTDVAGKQTTQAGSSSEPTANASKEGAANKDGNKEKTGDPALNEEKAAYSAMIQQATRQTEADLASFVIDKNIGMITVTAKPVSLKHVEDYVNNLKKELYRQVSIEAKIIEVYLQDNSKIGLDWSNILKDYNLTGTVSFGNNGQVYPYKTPSDPTSQANTFVSKVTIDALNFNVLLNALNEQGDASVISNPKLTVVNGQAALISIGEDRAYIKTVTKTVSGTGTDSDTTYTAEVGNVVQGISMGVMANIISDKRIMLHLTPITTDLVGNTIPYRTFGNEGLEVGLPDVRVREMSTMVQVDDGEMLIIGGLIDTVEAKDGKFAPGLGSIPGIKYLFGYEETRKEKRELVILLTPRII